MKAGSRLVRTFATWCRFMAQVARRFPTLYVVLLLTLALLVLEYASLSLMIPLSTGQTGSAADRSSITVSIWTSIARALGLAPMLITWVWLFLVLLALRSVAGYAHQALATMLSKQVHRELSKSVFEQIVFREPLSEVYRRTVGFYISLAGDDTFRAGTLINSALQVLAALVSVAAGLVLLFLFSAFAFRVTLVFLLLSGIGVALCAQGLLRLDARAVLLSREARTAFLEALNSLRSIRSMGSEAFVHASYSGQMRAYTRLLFLVEVFKNSIRFFPGIVALAIGIVVLSPWQAGLLSIEASTIFAATTILIRVFLSLGALMTAGGALLIDSRAAKDLGILIDIQSSSPPSSLPRNENAAPRSPVERVDVVDVDYGYDHHRKVVDGLSLSLRRGRSYSVVGPSGTGKSTLADLLLGLLAPTAGEIRIDGQPVQAADLRSRVILVEQQPRIFSVSVRDNVTLGVRASDAEVADALATVELTEYVGGLASGVDTVLNYQGANLSGGQRQRLALARALLRKPEILILDEATSALDAPTEQLVLRSVRRAMQSGILILVTHDPEVAAAADEVIDLQSRAPNPQPNAAVVL
jgi:ABC-type multidrug transport system fused ATPase/permease subunit